MIRFLIDEDLPRSTAKVLREAGFESLDVRDIGLRGARDDVIYRRAQEENCIIITGDLGFANSLRYPLGSHPGLPDIDESTYRFQLVLLVTYNLIKRFEKNSICKCSSYSK